MKWASDYEAEYKAQLAEECGFRILGPRAASAVPELRRLSGNTNSYFACARAIRALGAIGTNGLPPIVEVLRSTNHPWRTEAARSLGEMITVDPSDKRAQQLLAECLSDGDNEVIVSASETVANVLVDRSLVVPALVRNLCSHSEHVRTAATNTLEKIAPEVLGGNVKGPA